MFEVMAIAPRVNIVDEIPEGDRNIVLIGTLNQDIYHNTSLLQKEIQHSRKTFFITSFINWSSLFACAMLFNNPNSQGLLSAATSLNNKPSLCGFGVIASAHLLGFGAQRLFEEKSEACRNLDFYFSAPSIAINCGLLFVGIRNIIKNGGEACRNLDFYFSAPSIANNYGLLFVGIRNIIKNGGLIECHPTIKLLASSLACTAAFLYFRFNTNNDQASEHSRG